MKITKTARMSKCDPLVLFLVVDDAKTEGRRGRQGGSEKKKRKDEELREGVKADWTG